MIHPGLLAGGGESGFAHRVGGVAQVGIALDYRTVAYGDVMVGLVALGIVGVGGMGPVGRYA